MNEMGLNANWLRKDMTHPETQAFSKEVLNHMRERLKDYQEQYGDLYNLEATPAESTTYRFAKHDKADFPHIITANENGTPYYTNSSHLPVGYTEDVFSALDIQDELQTLYTSGTVFHAFLGEKLPDWKAAANLVRKIAENYRLPYYTLSPTYSVCREHGYLAGEQYVCPHCGQKTEVYSRITGYYRPVQNWNDGKAQEYKDRKVYDLGVSYAHFNQNVTFDQPAAAAPAAAPSAVELETKKAPETAQAPATGLLLFTTSTCPKCVMAKKFLADAGLSYDTVVVDKDPALAKQYGVRQAPTLLVLDGGKEIQRVENPSNIRAFCEANRA